MSQPEPHKPSTTQESNYPHSNDPPTTTGAMSDEMTDTTVSQISRAYVGDFPAPPPPPYGYQPSRGPDTPSCVPVTHLSSSLHLKDALQYMDTDKQYQFLVNQHRNNKISTAEFHQLLEMIEYEQCIKEVYGKESQKEVVVPEKRTLTPGTLLDSSEMPVASGVSIPLGFDRGSPTTIRLYPENSGFDDAASLASTEELETIRRSSQAIDRTITRSPEVTKKKSEEKFLGIYDFEAFNEALDNFTTDKIMRIHSPNWDMFKPEATIPNMDVEDESFPTLVKKHLPNLPPQERLSFLKYHYDEGNIDMRNYVELTAYILHMDQEAHDQIVMDESTGTKVKTSVINRAVANQPWGGLTVTFRPEVAHPTSTQPHVTLTEVEPFTEVVKRKAKQKKTITSAKTTASETIRLPLLPTPENIPAKIKDGSSIRASKTFDYGRLSHKFLDNSTGFNGSEVSWPFYYGGDQCYHCGRPGFIRMYCPYLNTLDEANSNWRWYMKRNHRPIVGSYYENRKNSENSRRGN